MTQREDWCLWNRRKCQVSGVCNKWKCNFIAEILPVHSPRTMTTVPALTVATRLVAKHSQPPWWSLLTGCSKREPLASTEYSEWGEGPIYCGIEYNTGIITSHTWLVLLPTTLEHLAYLAPCYGWRGVSTAFTWNDQISAHFLVILRPRKHPERWRVLDEKEGRMWAHFFLLAQTKHLWWGAYLQKDLSGFRLSHGTITVICCTCVHAHSIIIGCCYKNWALRVNYPPRVLKENITQNDLPSKCAACDIFSSMISYIIKIQIISIFSPVNIECRGVGLDRADDNSLHPCGQICLPGHSTHTSRVWGKGRENYYLK